ncbi:Bulb-type lectin domain containing protein [Trema orientale]|uniref:Bulb-type lectin domain containing protein n=1 Tax=Trema orientale TaxID=63057 RepID=A0A2P5F455_TREOI|nr:Bulb-type lectin domain containing protein [Trema orientale]
MIGRGGAKLVKQSEPAGINVKCMIGFIVLFFPPGQSQKSRSWSTSVSVPESNSSMAKLLDVGNLVLLQNNSTKLLYGKALTTQYVKI